MVALRNPLNAVLSLLTSTHELIQLDPNLKSIRLESDAERIHDSDTSAIEIDGHRSSELPLARL